MDLDVEGMDKEEIFIVSVPKNGKGGGSIVSITNKNKSVVAVFAPLGHSTATFRKTEDSVLCSPLARVLHKSCGCGDVI